MNGINGLIIQLLVALNNSIWMKQKSCDHWDHGESEWLMDDELRMIMDNGNMASLRKISGNY